MKKKSNSKGLATKGMYAAAGLFLARKLYKTFTELDVSNKVVLITGGSRGLGLILARQLADMQAKVVICGRNEKALSVAGKDLAGRTEHTLALPCDITNKAQVKRMVKEVEEKIGRVEILINNAGMIQVGPMDAMKEEDYEQAMQTHFWGPFYVMNVVIPSMIENKKGRIVNIVSIGGKLSVPHLLPYAASKFALSGLSEGFTTELASKNIKVTTVYPGLMRTGSPRNIDVKGDHEKEYAWFKISDSLPLLSMNAERAARKIIKAMRRGEKSLTLSFPAKLGNALHAIAPNLTLSLFDLANRLLPDAENGNGEEQKGHESESQASTSLLTKMTERAEKKYNQLFHKAH